MQITNQQTNINSDLLRRLRSDQRWSQEELAIAAGLSTRTVQRLEATGRGSVGSIKAIAGALQIEVHNLEADPRTHAVGVRYGLIGVGLGALGATIGIAANASMGHGSAFDTGVALGVVGFLSGMSCAIIGWLSNRA